VRNRTDYFSLLLRDIFNAPEYPRIEEIPDTVVPVYNLAPPDLPFAESSYIAGPPGAACPSVTLPSVITYHGSYGAPVAAHNILIGLPAGCVFRIRWRFCYSAAATHEVFLRSVTGGVTRVIGNAYNAVTGGVLSQNPEVITCWMTNPAATDITFQLIGVGSSGYLFVSMEVIPQ